MQFDASTPRQDIIVQGQVFSCIAPFREGSVLKENEASQMNQVLGENLRNNVAGKMKDKDGNTVAFTQEQFDAYAAEYEFGARRSGGSEAKLSPVEREARRIARDRLDARLRELGKKIDKKSDEGKANYETLIAQIAAKPEVLREAEKRVKAVDKISIEELGLDLSGATAQAQAA